MKKIDLELLSKYRTPLMGLSALLIIICHASTYHVEMPPVVRFLLSFGNVGVDIFLFLSGVGCCYSLNRGGRYQNGTKRDSSVFLFHTY